MVQHVTDAIRPLRWRLRFKRRLLRATAHLYDIFFTTNVYDLRQMETKSPPIALLTDLGYDPYRFESSPLSEDMATKWNHPLIFVGHHEPHTEAGILSLIDAGLPVTVFGHAPWFRSRNRQKLGEHLRPSLGDEDYVNALKGAKIGLCFVSKVNYNLTASRSFEIPGSGTFLLAARTPQHAACFKEGVEAEFFGDHHELVDKARYYLSHEDERERIARRGHERCISSGYSWDALMARDWPKVTKLFAERRHP